MIPILAMQSVERKLEMQSSVMLGNYEFYYGAGKLSSLIKIDGDGGTPPAELAEAVRMALKDFVPADEKTAYLVQMIKKFHPDESYDPQMSHLFLWGALGREPQTKNDMDSLP